ncbi:MAG TPA: hypothetical protein EYP28_04370 [Methanophagales archaeon]|nr:hypothetical protein [Methanophagales archaeon]
MRGSYDIINEQRDSLGGVTDWLTLDNVNALAAGQHHKLKPIAAEIVPSENCIFGCRTCPYANKKSGAISFRR